MRFRAGVQYGDWKGTAASDNADTGALGKYMKDAGLLNDSEFLVGFEAYIGETRLNANPHFSCRAFVVDGKNFESVKTAVEDQSPLPVMIRELSVDINGFFKLFKRFDIVLTHRGLDLTDRDYVEVS